MLKTFRQTLCALSVMAASALCLSPINAHGQETAPTPVPDMPAPIRNLAEEGAQTRYMGREHGFDAWVSVKNGQEQFFYVPPGGTGFVMGILFDNDGRIVTIDQIRKLDKDGKSVVSDLSDPAEIANGAISKKPDAIDGFKSPSQRLFADTEQSNWIALGQASAPAVYAIIDPQCPHCHKLLKTIIDQGHLDNGAFQLRLIPVGMSHQSKAQAAYLIAAPNPAERFLKHLGGDESALPVRSDINVQGVDRNLNYMQSWKFDGTPVMLYRNKDGEVKIIFGASVDIPAMLADLPKGR